MTHPGRARRMHELALAAELVAVVEDAARAAGARRVTAVVLRVGDLSGVAVDALRFAYDVVAAGTLLAGSRLDARRVPVTVHCPRCDRRHELPGVPPLACPRCGGPTPDVRAGRELEVESVEVE